MINALRKEVDRRQIEFVKSGKLLPVAFSSRHYDFKRQKWAVSYTHLDVYKRQPINVYAHQQLLSGTHKNLRRLVFAQSIQLSNIVLVRKLLAPSF